MTLRTLVLGLGVSSSVSRRWNDAQPPRRSDAGHTIEGEYRREDD